MSTPNSPANRSYASRLRCANKMLPGSENVALTPPKGFAEDPDPSRSRSMTKMLPTRLVPGDMPC